MKRKRQLSANSIKHLQMLHKEFSVTTQEEGWCENIEDIEEIKDYYKQMLWIVWRHLHPILHKPDTQSHHRSPEASNGHTPSQSPSQTNAQEVETQHL